MQGRFSFPVTLKFWDQLSSGFCGAERCKTKCIQPEPVGLGYETMWSAPLGSENGDQSALLGVDHCVSSALHSAFLGTCFLAAKV